MKRFIRAYYVMVINPLIDLLCGLVGGVVVLSFITMPIMVALVFSDPRWLWLYALYLFGFSLIYVWANSPEFDTHPCKDAR